MPTISIMREVVPPNTIIVNTTVTSTVVRSAGPLSPFRPAASATPTAPRRPAQKSMTWYECGSSSLRWPRARKVKLMILETGKTAQ